MSGSSPEPHFLRRRNALWQQLRQAEPGTPEFGALLAELSAMIGWNRERVLAGLGLNELSDEPSGAVEELEED